MSVLRNNWLPLIIVAIGFCASAAVAIAPFSYILTHVIPDDSYYYFQVARNVVHGFGPTFDGVNLTNGYHPLWMLLLLPIFKYFSAAVVMDIAPIHASLMLAAIFHGLFGLVLLAIVSRYTSNPWIKAIALAAWFFNPFNIYQMLDGLETSLSMFFVALFFLTSLRYNDQKTKSRLVIVGIVGGLMMLSRLDNVFYFLMFLLWLMYSEGSMRSLRNVVFVGAIATIVVSPWLVFNFFIFGMFFTSASVAYTVVNHHLIYQDNGSSWFQTFKAVIFMTDHSIRTFVLPRSGAPSVYLALLGLTAGWFLFARERVEQWWRQIPVEIFLGAGCVLNFIANASIRWSPREWYFIAFNFLIALWIAWLLEKLRQNNKLRPDALIVIVVFTLSLYYIGWSKNLKNGDPTANEMLAATLWMNENIPSATTVGAFNAGIEGYFSTHRLINLDGLINNAAAKAIIDRRLWTYIESENIVYIADFGKRFSYRMKGFLDTPDIMQQLAPVFESGGLTVYKIK